MTFLNRRALAFGLSLAILLFFLAPLLAQTAKPSAPLEKININTATVEELSKLPRIGAKVAQRIVDYRKEHGNFKKIEELMKVRGIGEKVFKNLKDLITVGEEEQKGKKGTA